MVNDYPSDGSSKVSFSWKKVSFTFEKVRLTFFKVKLAFQKMSEVINNLQNTSYFCFFIRFFLLVVYSGIL